MWEVLAQVIPLNLAATLSPGLFAAALFLLGSKKNPVLRAFVLLLGSILVALVIVIIGAILGNPDPDETSEKIFAILLNCLLGVLFIFFAFRTILAKDRKIDLNKLNQPKYWYIFIFGVIVNATNLDAVFLSLTAAKEVADSPDISILSKVALLIINMLFFTLPIWLPIVFYLISPKTAMPILQKFNKTLIKYGKYIIFVVFLVMGSWLFYEGIRLIDR